VLLSICPTLISLNKLRLKNRSLLAKNTIGSRLEPIDYLRYTISFLLKSGGTPNWNASF
jgi:hypothetical protein